MSGMAFLDYLSDGDKERLANSGEVVAVDGGDYLLRRGTEGGDIFLVETGRFEVVDTRKTPEMILDVLGAGRVVGEMAFIDQAPRVADVRALERSTVRLWNRDELLRMLASDEALSSRFFRALCASTVSRLRATGQVAVGLSSGLAPLEGGGVNAAVVESVRTLAQQTRDRWAAADALLKSSDSHVGAEQRIARALEGLVEDIDSWLSGVNSMARSQEAGNLLRAEMRFWLARSRTGILSGDTRKDSAARLSFLAHMLRGRAEGTDVFGETLDAAILALPTPTALRERQALCVDAVVAGLPTDRRPEIVLIEPACGALLARITSRIVAGGAGIHCVDGDPQTLAFLDAGLHARPAHVDLRMINRDVVSLVMGEDDLDIPPVDVVVLNGIVDFLPTRMISGLLTWCIARLGPGGRVVMTALQPTPDGRFMEHILGWPTMRRTGQEITRVTEAAGLRVVSLESTADKRAGGLVAVAELPDNSQS